MAVAHDGSTSRFFDESWLAGWGRAPEPPPTRLERWLGRARPAPTPWYRRPWSEPPAKPPWHARFATPAGTPGASAGFARPMCPRPLRDRVPALGDRMPELRGRVQAVDDALAPARAAARRLPVLRAFGVPLLMGVFFSLVSLVVGADLVGRVRAWLPHRTHVVQPGESLSAIAAQYGVADWRDLYGAGDNARRFENPNAIPAGSRLDLPYGASLPWRLPLLMARDVGAMQRSLCATLSDVRVAGWQGNLRLCAGPGVSTSR